MTQANLTETLFKPRFKHPETSTLVRRFNPGTMPAVQSALDGKNVPHWYRMINRLMWIWRGIDPREILDVQARIVMSESERTDGDLYDTVVGYRGGNWIYEWSKQAMLWQQKASQEEDATLSGKHWLHAANLYSIAAYPHLKGDELAEQAQALANRVWSTQGIFSSAFKACWCSRLESCVSFHLDEKPMEGISSVSMAIPFGAK